MTRVEDECEAVINKSHSERQEATSENINI